MKQVETRYMVVRKSDNFLWQGGRTEYFIPNMAAAKFYTTREIAEKQLHNAWWWEREFHKENYVIKEVTITYEIME